MSGEVQEQAVPVHGRDLGWAKAAYQSAGVPIISIVALGNGAYAIVIAAPTGTPAPDWRSMPTRRSRSWWERLDWARWAPVLLQQCSAACQSQGRRMPLALRRA